ncbi:hypothetical protein C8T65DRAFT_655931 [Cerioporus squamosus]|nr:hypothetical protein C8T65DRAFT_655931 [Cerioporus squamosus]
MYAPLRVGHHSSLPETPLHPLRKLPALFFACAAFQRDTACDTTGVYGALLYWSLPQLCITLVFAVVVVPLGHLGWLLHALDNAVKETASLAAKIFAFLVLHALATFIDVVEVVVLLMSCITNPLSVLLGGPPERQRTGIPQMIGVEILLKHPIFDYGDSGRSKRTDTTAAADSSS